MTTTSNDNMLTNKDSILDSEIKNKGFVLLCDFFISKGWHMSKNEMVWIIFSKVGNETDNFEIRVHSDSIQVTIPLKNSKYQYVTVFKSYFEASEYMEQRLLDFI